jgi:hypothetical protein
MRLFVLLLITFCVHGPKSLFLLRRRFATLLRPATFLFAAFLRRNCRRKPAAFLQHGLRFVWLCAPP